MSKHTIQFSVKKPELKQAIDIVARSKGYNNAAQMARVALNEFIRRHPPKDCPAVLQDWLNGKI
jgi:hypothetical protein